MRIIRNCNGFELVYVNKEARKKLLHGLEVENRRVMRRCLNWAIKENERKQLQLEQDGVVLVACALFDKVTLKAFTVLAEEETRRTFNEKEMAKAISALPKTREIEQAGDRLHSCFCGAKGETRVSFLVNSLSDKAIRGPPLLVVLCGPSHSGKSTFAHELGDNFKVISSDEIRSSLSVGFGGKESEERVWEIFESKKRKALAERRSIILDACHASPEARWHALQGPNGGYKKICIVFNLPWSVVRERSLKTERVSLAEVERMWRTFQKTKAEPGEFKRFDEVYVVLLGQVVIE